VLLHPGYSTRRIAAELKSAGIIRSEDAFVLWHYLHHRRSLKAGEYLFEKPANTINIHRRLAHGDVYFHTVVVPEGYTMFDIAHAIEGAGLGPATDFLKVAQSDTPLIADLAPGAHSLEGYLFPETYEFTRMQSMEDMAAAMVKQFRQVARQIGLIQSSGGNARGSESATSTPADRGASSGEIQMPDIQPTVTVASIIEKETAVPDERPLVASVYFNRLEKKIALDADPVRLREVLANLVVNAIRHTPPDGTVAVQIGIEGGDAMLSVDDSCGGIPEDEISRVFDVAFRGTQARTPERSGTTSGGGLGLAIAKGLVEAHSGRIGVHNRGPGCRFEVRLPLAVP